MQLRKLSLQIIAIVLLALSPVLSARGQESELVIEVQPQAGPPGTTVNISGRGAGANTVSARFLAYWQQNGGLPVFGYPITPARNERNRDTGETYLAQWFERNRFESHPENQPPYDVLLGRLGDDLLLARGVNWHTLPPAEALPGCMWFGQTRHNVCDQGNGLGFRTYWMTHGIEFDGRPGKSYDENLAVFGYPLTEAYMDTNPDGDHVLMQWFERARFEWHTDNPDQFKVLLGRLGAELLPVVAEPEQAPDEVVQRSRQALAGHLDIEPGQLTLQRASEERWPNPALGCPASDHAYPEVVTPGFQLLFVDQTRTYDIRTDSRGERIVLCRRGMPIDLTGVASGS